MLYENEPIRLYNPVVGEFEDTKAVYSDEDQRFVEAGRQLESLVSLPGWGQVEDFITESVAEYKDKLILASDIDQIRRLQEAIKAYSNVLHFVNQKINEAKSFDVHRTPDIQGQSIGGK